MVNCGGESDSSYDSWSLPSDNEQQDVDSSRPRQQQHYGVVNKRSGWLGKETEQKNLTDVSAVTPPSGSSSSSRRRSCAVRARLPAPPPPPVQTAASSSSSASLSSSASSSSSSFIFEFAQHIPPVVEKSSRPSLVPTSERHTSWLHCNLDRQQAEAHLLHRPTGSFVVRNKKQPAVSSVCCPHVLSVRGRCKTYHINIYLADNHFTLGSASTPDSTQRFTCVDALVRHYSAHEFAVLSRRQRGAVSCMLQLAMP